MFATAYVTLLLQRSKLSNYIIDRGSSGQPFQVKRSEQTERRWEMIKTNISNEDQNLLDIGCDAGLLTAHAAEEGLLSIGVDRYETFEGGKRICP